MPTVGPRITTRYETGGRRRRLLFVISREQPHRYDSLADAFGGDEDVKVIFDRRRGERRQRSQVPVVERRSRDRRSAIRAWAVGAVGWIRVAVVPS
jgi:hypothetical protein